MALALAAPRGGRPRALRRNVAAISGVPHRREPAAHFPLLNVSRISERRISRPLWRQEVPSVGVFV